MTLLPVSRLSPGKRVAYLSGECQFVIGFCVFSAFLRGDRATACNLELITPVEANRPLLYIFDYTIIRWSKNFSNPCLAEGPFSKNISDTSVVI
jgi:hypothetical protein